MGFIKNIGELFKSPEDFDENEGYEGYEEVRRSL